MPLTVLICRYVALPAVLLAIGASAGGRPAGPPVLLQSKNLPTAVEPEVLQQQFATLSSMPDVEVEYSTLGPVSSISGDSGIVLPADVRQVKEGSSGKVLLEAFRSVLLATGSETLTVAENRLSPPKERQIRAEESIGGIPVVGGVVSLALDEETGRVRGFVAGFLPDRDLPKKPKLSAPQARQALVRALEASGDARPGTVREIEKAKLAYFGIGPESMPPQLVWEMRIGFVCPTGRQDDELVWVDAIDGSVAGRRPQGEYFVSPGPCQRDESEEVSCISEPDASLNDAPFSSSCGEPSARPRLIVTRIGCSDSFRLSWPRIPGASQYHVIRAPTKLGWAFARTVVGGYVHQCTVRVDGPNMVKMRPCDGCGCGEWSDTLVMDPQAACQ